MLLLPHLLDMRVEQLLSHVAEQKLKHERMVQLQNQIMSENARLHGAIQVAGDNLERTGHISRDLEFANQMVRDENQRCACLMLKSCVCARVCCV